MNIDLSLIGSLCEAIEVVDFLKSENRRIERYIKNIFSRKKELQSLGISVFDERAKAMENLHLNDDMIQEIKRKFNFH